jgi:uncharacterized protein YjiS (DUF1127 family)
MSCGSTNYTSATPVETVAPAFADLGWCWQISFAWLCRMALRCDQQRQRRELFDLDDRLLADIGLSRRQAVEESLKSFWAYSTWHVYR